MNVEIQQFKVKQITPYHDNPRINEGAVEYVKNSIDQFGFLVPIVIDGEHEIITGHTRYQAAKALKLKTVPVIVAEHLSEPQIKAFRLADNKVAEYSGWDESLLAKELQELEAMGFNLMETGFSKDELDCLVEPVDADCLEDLDLNSVCGDVATVTITSKAGVTLSIGGYNISMAIDDWHAFEKDLLKKHGGKHAIRKEMFKRLGLGKYVKRDSDALNLKKSLSHVGEGLVGKTHTKQAALAEAEVLAAGTPKKKVIKKAGKK